MIRINDKQNCSGCHACASICPKSCIKMARDEEGFLYPVVDEASCIDCGKCEKVCPIINNSPKDKSGFPVAYAAISKNHDEKKHSSSGGVFSIIAEYVINQGGVVFGAAFNESFEVEHIQVEDLSELYRLRGSKYVQSKIGTAYLKVKSYLDQNRLVLFTGTPCQIAGLKAFLKKEYRNLLCQDIVCHGVPSPLVWERYIEYRERDVNSKLSKMSFRDKTYGWKNYSILFEYENGTQYRMCHREDLYMKAFLMNYSLRPSCYQCAFKGVHRISDFTLADFWHVNTYTPDMYREDGVSLVFVHTEKAKQLFDLLKENMVWKCIENNDVGLRNLPMVQSVAKPKNRKHYFRELFNGDFGCVTSKYCRKSRKEMFKQKVKSLLIKLKIMGTGA